MFFLMLLVQDAGAHRDGLSFREALRRDAITLVGKERIVQTKNVAPQGELISMEEYVARLTTAHAELIDKLRVLRPAGQLKEAVQATLDCLAYFPNSQSARMDLFDLYFELRQWHKAYAAVAPEAIDDHRLVLRSCLASSLMGKTYPGQREFLLTWILGSNGRDRELILSCLPAGESAKEIVFLSLVAIGQREFLYGSLGEYNAALYLKYAAAMDWGNPLIAEMLGKIYVRSNRMIEAEIYLASAVERAKGSFEWDIHELLRRARGG